MSSLEGEILKGDNRSDDGRHDDDPKNDHGSRNKQEENIRSKFWQTLGRAASQIPFVEELIAAYYCAFDPQTPNSVRMKLFGALAYFVLPIDMVPDFIAGIGFGDDAALLMWVISSVRSHINDRHRTAARDKMREMQGQTQG